MNIGKENEEIEFKKSTSETKEGIQSICAILNKKQKGCLYFGVKDNGEVLGQQIGKDTLNKLSRDISDNIEPSIMYSINERKSVDGKSFIEVSFSGNQTPYSAYGRYYIRFHDEDRQMDNQMFRKYYSDNNNDYSAWEKSDSGVDIANTNEELLVNVIEEANRIKRVSYKFTTKKEILGKLGLMFGKTNFNNAGNVLFSKNSPVVLKMAVFAAETKLTIIDLNRFEGNIFECINKAIRYIAKNIKWKADFNGKAQRTETPEIPMEAVREIIVNAFSHGNYHSRTNFEIDIYSNRITIYSPGHFPKPYKPEDFAYENIEPIPLNNIISNVLYKNGLIEQFSTGFERVFKLCKNQNIKYEYKETNDGFRFIFYRNTTGEIKLSATDKKIINIIENKEKLTAEGMANRLGITIRTVYRSISKLTNNNIIKRIGSDKTGYWEITNN